MSHKPASAHQSWFEQSDEERRSLEQLSRSVYRSLTPIHDIQHTLQETRTPFQDGEVLPFQCRKAISTLGELNTRLERLHPLLKDAQTLPLSMIALRYQLFDELYFVEEQTDNLLGLIDSFYEVCLTSSPHITHEIKAIDKLFATILRHIAELPQKVSFLLDEARFQEKQLAE